MSGGQGRLAAAAFGIAACSGASATGPAVPQSVGVARPPKGPARVGAEPVSAAEEVAAEPVRPTKPQAYAATRVRLPGTLARLTPTVALPGGGALVAWLHSPGANASEAQVVVVRLSLGPEGGWSVTDEVTVFDARTPWRGEDEPPSVAVSLAIEDFDDDGDAEVRVRTRREIMCPGGGPNTITELRIYNLVPVLSVALETELHHSIDAQPGNETRATVVHLDTDGDGHRDVRIDYVATSDGSTVRTRNDWRFEGASDTWQPHTVGNAAFACDW